LLAVAKISSDEWYQRALKAAKFFTEGQQTEKNISHRILLGSYRIFRTGDYQDNKIHSIDLLEQLHDLGIPEWVKQDQLSGYLSAYDPAIRTKQINIKIDGYFRNRHGYEWHTFTDSFDRYISQKERDEIEQDLGLVAFVATIAPVAPMGGTPRGKEDLCSPRVVRNPATSATSATGTVPLF
jgi:Protein of unknown function (DUF3631)